MSYKNIRRRIAFFKAISLIISYLLHPLLMPSLTFAIVFYFSPTAVNMSPGIAQRLLWMIFVLTFAFPMVSTFLLLYLLKRKLSVSDLMMDNRQDRVYPFLYVSFFYFAVTWLLIRSGVSPNIVAIMGGISIAVLLVTGITWFWKISAHAVGIGGTLGYCLIVSYYYPHEAMLYPIAGVIMLSGFLMSARLFLNKHTPAQVFGGIFLGVTVSILTFMIFQSSGMNLIY